jgi:ABC-type Fe3+/spermidine/putrescine transport system ATPase subunit
MNLITGAVRDLQSSGGTVTIDVEGAGTIVLRYRSALRSGSPVKVAARPEWIRLVSESAEGIRGSVESVAADNPGVRYLVRIGSQRIDVHSATPFMVGTRPAQAGDQVTVVIDPALAEVIA